jgi:hypothetical protein
MFKKPIATPSPPSSSAIAYDGWTFAFCDLIYRPNHTYPLSLLYRDMLVVMLEGNGCEAEVGWACFLERRWKPLFVTFFSNKKSLPLSSAL